MRGFRLNDPKPELEPAGKGGLMDRGVATILKMLNLDPAQITEFVLGIRDGVLDIRATMHRIEQQQQRIMDKQIMLEEVIRCSVPEAALQMHEYDLMRFEAAEKDKAEAEAEPAS